MEKGIVARDCRSLRRETTPGNNPFLHFVVQSVLGIDVEVEELEASENPTQSLEIHNIIPRRKQLLTVKIYIILQCKHERMVPRPQAA